MPDDPAMDRPRALLIQMEADPLADPHPTLDEFTAEEWAYFWAHAAWEGEIVSTPEFLIRLLSQRDASPEPAPEPPPTPFRLSDNRPTKARQMALFGKED